MHNLTNVMFLSDSNSEKVDVIKYVYVGYVVAVYIVLKVENKTKSNEIE